ncbi:twin-arginine translocase TatA/TatE family subunit [Actinotalea sp.]|uniref:twin-arginine translocase TatA/TatE family subunit n=1 Tax=Actinotalea sp. TaxID=1872145 RepID=UPI003565F081
MPSVNGGEFLILLIVAVVIVGPERLPRYAQQLGTWVRALRDMFTQAKDRVAEELGEEAKEVDWASLDPRQYDPRRIVRDALLEPPRPVPTTGRRYTSGAGRAAAATGAATASAQTAEEADLPTPFDDEAT